MSNSNGASPGASATSHSPHAATSVVDYEVAHQMNGRLRLRVLHLAGDPGFVERVLQAVQALPTIETARVNVRSASLVVTYHWGPSHVPMNGHPHVDSATMLQLVVECVRRAAGADVARDVTPPPIVTQPRPQRGLAAARLHPATAGDGETDGDRINYVKRLGLPALGAGLTAGITAGLAIPAVLVGGVLLTAALPIFRRTVQGIREEKRLTVEFLDSLTIVLLTAQASFFGPALIVGVIESSEIVRDWTARRSKQASLSLLLAHDRQVLVERGGQELRLAWNHIEAGDVIHVYAGDQIPVDGIVLAGDGLLDQRHLTGDSVPIACHEGDAVHASALVADGHLRILATATGHDTRAAALLALTNSAPSADTRVSNHARKVGNWAVVPTLAAGGAVLATSGSLMRATSIVSLDFGVGMRVSAPIAVVSAQAYAAQHGILIRSGRALEMLAQVNNVVFDKTGTLTQGNVQVVDICAVPSGVEPLAALQLAASAEHALDHPLARAIARHAQEQGLQPQPSTAWHYSAGRGIVADIDGQTVHVGSRRWMEEIGVAVDAAPDHDEDVASAAATHVYVALDGQLIGVIRCVDPLRPESAEVVARLRSMNIASFMVSGDSQPVAYAAAISLGIDSRRVHAEALPQQKVERVLGLQAAGRKVAVVGDGINDAVAMAHADVSIALGSATDLARETADIVLLNDDLRDLVAAVEIARQAMRIIEQNQVLAVAPNVGTIAYGMLAVLNPMTALLINNGTAVVAALNSLRPLKGPGAPALPPAMASGAAHHQTNPRVIDA